MILKKSIGISYMWNENTFSMMSMLQMVIRAHERSGTANVDYEQLGIIEIDNGQSSLRSPTKRRKVSNRKEKK